MPAPRHRRRIPCERWNAGGRDRRGCDRHRVPRRVHEADRRETARRIGCSEWLGARACVAVAARHVRRADMWVLWRLTGRALLTAQASNPTIDRGLTMTIVTHAQHEAALAALARDVTCPREGILGPHSVAWQLGGD